MKKLELHKETLLDLTEVDLAGASGGAAALSHFCLGCPTAGVDSCFSQSPDCMLTHRSCPTLWLCGE